MLLPNIAICSMFRDSQEWCGYQIDQVVRYFDQINNQQNLDLNKLKIFCLEGDSKDNTLEILKNYAAKSIVQTNIFTKKNSLKDESSVNSLNSNERIKALSQLANYLLTKIDLDWADLVLWIESDIIIEKTFISQIYESYLEIMRRKEGATQKGLIVSPLVMLGRLFYDTWAFKNVLGAKWTTQLGNRLRGKGYIEMQSIGTCALFPSALLKDGITFEDGAFIRLCELARANGYHIYCDTNLQVNHPNKKCIANRWV